jgi:hypothetical protein
MFHIFLPLVAELLLLKCYPQEENLDKTEPRQFVPEVYNTYVCCKSGALGGVTDFLVQEPPVRFTYLFFADFPARNSRLGCLDVACKRG